MASITSRHFAIELLGSRQESFHEHGGGVDAVERYDSRIPIAAWYQRVVDPLSAYESLDESEFVMEPLLFQWSKRMKRIREFVRDFV
jgi:hypothetical protein